MNEWVRKLDDKEVKKGIGTKKNPKNWHKYCKKTIDRNIYTKN